MWLWYTPVFLLLVAVGDGKLFLFMEPNQYDLSSIAFNYPDIRQELDVIWRYTHSIEIFVNELQLDGGAGDFILVSEHPLTFEDTFLEYNNTDRLPPSFLADSIVTTQGLILSWEISPSTKFHILSKRGTFLYFHFEERRERSRFPYSGFNITINDLDEMRLPPPTTTTEGVYIPPEPELTIYTSKFLRNSPFEFREQKEEFKEVLADISSEYCREEVSDCGQFMTSNFTHYDVSIPTESGLHMCDTSWDTYKTCVEVTFAITRKEENDGSYLMPKWRLDEMWEKKGHLFELRGFLPYDDHPKEGLGDMNTWMWVASVLALMLFLMVPICIFWVFNEIDHKALLSLGADNGKEEEAKDDEGSKLWRDMDNPIRPVIAKLRKQSEDSKYFEVGMLGRLEDDNDIVEDNRASSSGGSGPTFGLPLPSLENNVVKTNILFQEQDVVFEYDNRAFEEEEEKEDEQTQQEGAISTTISEKEDDESDIVVEEMEVLQFNFSPEQSRTHHHHQHHETREDLMEVVEESFPTQDFIQFKGIKANRNAGEDDSDIDI